ncbi:MBL fold metallo-hydrolase [Seohaeicola zhoushanensis]|uniref:MBL fold hydrolase n=1 Tax=Seohaeicola zhoushanensis TaxID=1569283 RepID=A0A8J3GV09_9RHOB|nr:MBL fold metallo-hydrolase [Seohaeicola zhoushanensis]GHF42001.1 MBL fold hydrolase [Seohaeicola zhoushanensis]
MTDTTRLSRRSLIAGAAALPLSAALPSALRAAAPMMGATAPMFNRIALGEFEVTTILAGSRPVPNPHDIFGLNASPEDFAAASAAANLPTDVAQFFFTPTVVNTGKELVLFDTGLSGEGTTAALAQAGYTPDQIDVVVLTHMHGDHIGGLMTGDAPTYPNARYVTGSAEFDHWDMSGNETFEKQMRPLAEKASFLDDGGSVTSGITAMAAFGHTPGHMTYMLESGGKQLLIGADFTNHYIWSLAHPDWQVKFDADKEMAATTRRKLLGMLAADKVPMIGYHMPFPGLGYVETAGEGYRYVPHSYQLLL